jgi:hypothetical protein
LSLHPNPNYEIERVSPNQRRLPAEQTNLVGPNFVKLNDAATLVVPRDHLGGVRGVDCEGLAVGREETSLDLEVISGERDVEPHERRVILDLACGPVLGEAQARALEPLLKLEEVRSVSDQVLCITTNQVVTESALEEVVLGVLFCVLATDIVDELAEAVNAGLLGIAAETELETEGLAAPGAVHRSRHSPTKIQTC